MAEPRQARVLANLADQTSGALLALQLEGLPDVVLQGGKYIIINTGQENSVGKLIKRAYSLFAVKPASQQFFLAAARVDDGIASHYLRSLKTGELLTFSGPWGRFHWPPGATEKTVVAAAFGSGITGILGYLPSVPYDCRVDLYWYQDAIPVLSDAMVLEWAQHPGVRIHHRMMNDNPLMDLKGSPQDARFVAAGEGARVDQCFKFLREWGVSEERLQNEIFYRSAEGLGDAKADG